MQMNLDFAPGLTAQFPCWEDVLSAAVYSCRQGLNGVAADLDMSPSELSRRLNRQSEDTRPLRAQDAIAIVQSTGDLRPVYWLCEKFLPNDEQRKQMLITYVSNLLPQLEQAMAALRGK